MPKFQSIIKRSLLTVTTLIFASTPAMPLVAFADAPACSAPPASAQPGVNQPTGSDAKTYIYNCGTGLWENAHYTYSPVTGKTTPKDPVVYTYNPSTGLYDKTVWEFDAASGSFYAANRAVVQPPAGATVIGGPPAAAASPAAGSSISDTGAGSTNTIDNNGTGGGSQSIDQTGPNSNNTINGTLHNNLNSNNSTGLGVTNVLTSQANTGNALVVGNTTGGNALSGNSQSMANIVNMLQSSSNALGSNAVTFVANIDGDVNGDLMLDPSLLANVQPATSSPSGNNNINVNNVTDATITNNIDLAATSGNAKVAENTTGGNAATGSAKAIANVVNIINSAIGAGKSFMGVININGNLNGDILLPPDFIDQLIASNVPTVTLTAPSSVDTTGPNSNNNVNNTNTNNTTVNNTNDLGINNKVNATATSGTAAVKDNTTAGNATTGNASTNITAFNLTGSKVLGTNDLLVFVNVLGKWVGLIVNAPAGSTAAELGGGITSNIAASGPNSDNSINNSNTNNTDVNNKTTQQINNNINVNATSGNALVKENTTGGNATSGDAQAAVNLLNVENSTFSLSNWFGVLFINVFGTWNGSFGINTSAGDPVATQTAEGGYGSGSGSMPASSKVFSFIPHTAPSFGSNHHSYSSNPYFYSTSNHTSGKNSGSAATTNQSVLASATIKPDSKHATPAVTGSHINWLIIAITGGIFVVSIASDQIYSRRNR